jgi:hypothetical protein
LYHPIDELSGKYFYIKLQENNMSYEQKIIATGIDFFFENVNEKTLLEMGSVLKAKIKFCEEGRGALTLFFNNDVEFTKQGIFYGLMKNSECGEHLANMFGCRYTGSEFYIKRLVDNKN